MKFPTISQDVRHIPYNQVSRHASTLKDTLRNKITVLNPRPQHWEYFGKPTRAPWVRRHCFLGNYFNYKWIMITRVSQTLGKMEPSDEEIRDWIKKGWKFTKRPRKGNHYITRRMGANKERSLGRYRQALWDRIERIKREPSEPQPETDPLTIFVCV